MSQWLQRQAPVPWSTAVHGRFGGAGPIVPLSSTPTRIGFGCVYLRQLALAIGELVQYHHCRRRWKAAGEDLTCLFRRFIGASAGRRCLHLTAGGAGRSELGANWSVVDLTQALGARGRMLELENGQIDAAFCSGLESVPQPARVIAELRRVLKRNAEVWIEVPFNAPCSVAAAGEPADFWRVSPDGLRVLMVGFDEIFCESCAAGHSLLRATSVFYGIKAGLPYGRVPRAREADAWSRRRRARGASSRP